MPDEGRDDRYARWYRTHYHRVLTSCRRILRDPDAAEDIAQETLLRAWTHRDQLQEEDLGAWLSVVSRNLSLSWIKSQRRVYLADRVPEKPDPSGDPAASVGRLETRRSVRQALARLGDRHRRVLILREMQDVGYEDIGSELGLTAEGARSIAFRARRLLMERLVAAGEGLSGLVFGVRLRSRNLWLRARFGLDSADAGMMVGFQSGLGAMLAIGLILSIGSPGFPTTTDREYRDQVSHVATGKSSIGAGEEAGNAPTGTLSKENGNSLRKAPRVPRLASGVSAKPLDQDDYSSDLTLHVGDEEIFVRRYRLEGDGLDGAFSVIGAALERTCRLAPVVCAALEGEQP